MSAFKTAMLGAAKQMGIAVTENGALSYGTSGDKRVDLFFHSCRGMSEKSLHNHLDEAAREDLLDTVKIVFNLRDCRGGKGERQLFYHAMAWLAKKHPQVYEANAHLVPFYGSFRDLLAQGAADRAALRLFANQLRADWEALEKDGEKAHISLAAKWAPTEGKMHDKRMKGMVGYLARKVSGEKGKMSRRSLKVYRVRMAALRKHVNIVERHMCESDYAPIDYSTVPSRAMHKYKKAFLKNDVDGFGAYMEALQKPTAENDGKVKINAEGLYPHEITKQLCNAHETLPILVAQWEALVEKVKEWGSLEKSLVLSDVSGSMAGVPMDVSIAMGLLISEVTKEPFKNLVLTFESKPCFHDTTADTLVERFMSLRRAPWGGSTNFTEAFELILNRAVIGNVPQSEMPTTLFVISDMQFNQADRAWSTNYECVKAKYAKYGYAMPRIVFWNVRGDIKDSVVTADTPGTSLVSGYSPSILKNLLKGKITTPYDTLRDVIDDERYSLVKLPVEGEEAKMIPTLALAKKSAEKEKDEKKEEDKKEDIMETEMDGDVKSKGAETQGAAVATGGLGGLAVTVGTSDGDDWVDVSSDAMDEE